MKPQLEVAGEVVPLVEVQRLHLLDERLDVVLGVQRLDGRMLAPQFLAEVLRVLILNMGRVEQHQLGDVGGRLGAEHGPAKPGLVQSRQVAAMVDVGVREDDRIEVFGPAVELLVLPPRLVPPPLKEPAVEQHPPVARLNQMLRPGDLARRPEKCDFHAGQCIAGPAALASIVGWDSRQAYPSDWGASIAGLCSALTQPTSTTDAFPP